MARLPDYNKIKRLKESTMKLVVEKGFGGASAVLISKDANVAVGYFYIHYHSKYEMVNAILHEVYQEVIDKQVEFMEQGKDFNETIKGIVYHIFTIANSAPMKIKFLYVLTNDYSFLIDKDVRENTYFFINQVREMGHESQQLDPKLSKEDLYLFVVVNTIQYINLRFKNSSENYQFTADEKSHLLYMIYKCLS
jgi:AcrR family transcriptional regulator